MKLSDHFKTMIRNLLLLMLLVSISKCSESETVTFTDKTGSVSFDFPTDWYENSGNHPYDLQCFSNDKTLTTGVFVYRLEDIAGDAGPVDLFESQINDLGEKRQNFEPLGVENVENTGGKKITSRTYSGEKGASRNFYQFNLIEFEEDSTLVIIVLQTGIPSRWENGKVDLDNIVRSARLAVSATGS